MSDRIDPAAARALAKLLTSARAYLLHQIAERTARAPRMGHSQAAQQRQLEALLAAGFITEARISAQLTPLGRQVHAITIGRAP